MVIDTKLQDVLDKKKKKQCWSTVCGASAVMGNWIYEGLMIEGNERFVTHNSKLFWPLTNCALACTRLMNMCRISSGRIHHQPGHEHGYGAQFDPFLLPSHFNIVKTTTQWGLMGQSAALTLPFPIQNKHQPTIPLLIHPINHVAKQQCRKQGNPSWSEKSSITFVVWDNTK